MTYTSILRINRPNAAPLRQIPQKAVSKNPALSIGFICPFQPTMQSKSKINETCVNLIKLAEGQLMKKYGPQYTWKIVERITKAFNSLNYNSFFKSIAVILEPDGDKIIYLNYHTVPVLLAERTISLSDLLSKTPLLPDFYLMVLEGNSVRFYEYSTDVSAPVSDKYPEYCPISAPVLRIYNKGLKSKQEVADKASAIYSFLNNKQEKPLFVTGDTEAVDIFYNSTSFNNLIFKKTFEGSDFSEENLEKMIAEISVQWSYWNDRYISNRILSAGGKNLLIFNTEAVLQTLKAKTDGLLILDQKLRSKLYDKSYENKVAGITDDLLIQMESFLERGNQIVNADSGLLKSFGRIVLIPNKPVSKDPLNKRLGNFLLF